VSTRRPRYRYIAFRIEGPRTFRRSEVLEALQDSLRGATVVDLRGAMGLVRCGHLEKESTIAGLTSIVSIAGERIRVTTVGTSGTIRKATQKYLR